MKAKKNEKSKASSQQKQQLGTTSLFNHSVLLSSSLIPIQQKLLFHIWVYPYLKTLLNEKRSNEGMGRKKKIQENETVSLVRIFIYM